MDTQTSRQKRHTALTRTAERLARLAAKRERTSDRLSSLRLLFALIGFGGAVVSFFATQSLALTGIVFLVGIVGFIAAVIAHGRVERALNAFRALREIKLTHLARMRLDWAAIPAPPPHTPDPEHPYEVDLDLSGPRSLHHLIDTAISEEGSAQLRAWLTAPTPDLAVIQARQRLVRELAPLTAYRDKLAVRYRTAGGRGRWEAGRLLGWLERHQANNAVGKWVARGLMVLIPLAGLNAGFFIYLNTATLPELGRWVIPFGLLVTLYLGIFLTLRSQIGDVFEDAMALGDILRRLEAIGGHLEGHRYQEGSALAALTRPFTAPESAPSRLLRRITTIVSMAGIARNPFLWLLINLALPLDLIAAWALNRAGVLLSERLPAWLAALAELEALSSLANFANLNPAYAFPTITNGPTHLEASDLGHPLIPEEGKVRNPITLDRVGQIVLITGSNMAGKSSFLRTLGLNMALAYAGSVVDAESLRLSRFRLFTCIKISDSLADGFSYFYAEVRRLRALLDALEAAKAVDSLPVFYLIDEIFRGTNNRERLIGSRAYVRALAAQAGLGAVSTHDLELVKLGEEIPLLQNKHFRESVAEGRMVFDYLLREGPCPTTNALRIMALAGLPTDE